MVKKFKRQQSYEDFESDVENDETVMENDGADEGDDEPLPPRRRKIAKTKKLTKTTKRTKIQRAGARKEKVLKRAKKALKKRGKGSARTSRKGGKGALKQRRRRTIKTSSKQKHADTTTTQETYVKTKTLKARKNSHFARAKQTTKNDDWKLKEDVLIARIGGKFYRVRVPDGRHEETLGLKFLSTDFAENVLGLPTRDLPETGFNRAIQYLTVVKKNKAKGRLKTLNTMKTSKTRQSLRDD